MPKTPNVPPLPDIREMVALFQADFTAITTPEFLANHHDSLGRLEVRVISGFLEAMCYNLRQLALGYFQRGGVEFSPEEIALLREETYSLDPKGDVVSQERFLNATSGILFTLRCFGRSVGSIVTVDLEGGWQAMRSFIKIRNRVTHPKSLSDMLVSMDELDIVTTANNWFLSELGKFGGIGGPQAVGGARHS